MNHPTLPPSTSTPLEYSLFSPSKAAQQQRLAKDWTYIHSFLASKYAFPLRVPKFEENEETLGCLLQLAAWNEKGDEGWRGMCGIEEMCLRGMEEEEGEVKTRETTDTLNTTLTTSLTTSLSANGTTDLTTQATTSILLNTSPSATNLATSLLTLSTSLSVLQTQLAATSTLQSSLLSHQNTLHSELTDLQSPTFKSESNLPQRTAEISRQTKLLKAKVAEYDERLRNTTSSTDVPEKLLVDVEAAKENAEVLVKRVKDVEEKIEGYEGVPPEAREVRRVMVELRGELEGWVRRRDGLFEGLVGGGR